MDVWVLINARWYYSSPTDIFASYAPDTSKLFLMMKSRYKKHVFITKNLAYPVYTHTH